MSLPTLRTTCVDKIFAIREMRLNPYIGFAQYADQYYTDPISKIGTMIDSEFSSAAGFCVASINGQSQIQIYLKPTTDKTVDGSLLVSSIYYQVLKTTETQLDISFDYWFYSNSGWIPKTR